MIPHDPTERNSGHGHSTQTNISHRPGHGSLEGEINDIRVQKSCCVTFSAVNDRQEE